MLPLSKIFYKVSFLVFLYIIFLKTYRIKPYLIAIQFTITKLQQTIGKLQALMLISIIKKQENIGWQFQVGNHSIDE